MATKTINPKYTSKTAFEEKRVQYTLRIEEREEKSKRGGEEVGQ